MHSQHFKKDQEFSRSCQKLQQLNAEQALRTLDVEPKFWKQGAVGSTFVEAISLLQQLPTSKTPKAKATLLSECVKIIQTHLQSVLGPTSVV